MTCKQDSGQIEVINMIDFERPIVDIKVEIPRTQHIAMKRLKNLLIATSNEVIYSEVCAYRET